MAEAAMAEEQAWINLARVTHLHCYYLLLPDQEVPVTLVAPHAYWNHVPKHPFQLPWEQLEVPVALVAPVAVTCLQEPQEAPEAACQPDAGLLVAERCVVVLMGEKERMVEPVVPAGIVETWECLGLPVEDQGSLNHHQRMTSLVATDSHRLEWE